MFGLFNLLLQLLIFILLIKNSDDTFPQNSSSESFPYAFNDELEDILGITTHLFLDCVNYLN
jgi:hypothetical protein